MGYQPKPRQYALKFRDAEFEGLEIVMASMTVGEWEEMMAPAPDDPAERAKRNDANLSLFADRVISWNLDGKNGKPLPVTLKALKGLDRPFVTALMAAWQLALLGVDPTSGSGSSDGGTNREMPPEMPQEPITAEDLEAMAATASPGSSGPMT
jgi:hypothetical protein